MNYANRDYEAGKSVALGSSESSPQQPIKWTISYQAIAPLAMLFDALIIVSIGILTGIVYHIETIGSWGSIQQFGGFAAVVAALFIAIANGRDLYTLPQLLKS